MRHFFSLGLRPFFLLAMISGIWVPMYVVAVLINDYSYPGELLDVLTWHGHEMIFGMVPAVLSGFLLTASANWTKSRPLSGLPLIAMVVVWLIARILLWFQPSDVLVYLAGPSSLMILMIYLIFKLKGDRNRILIPFLLFLLVISNILYLYSSLGDGGDFKEEALVLGQAAIFLFIYIFSGRLIPFFTNIRFKREVVVRNLGLETGCLSMAVVFFVLELFSLSDNMAFPVLGGVLFFVFLVRGFSLFHRDCLQEPMILCFHLAHFWLVLYFPLAVIESAVPGFNAGRPALHSLLAGGFALFAFSIMSRASLGHSGREIKATGMMIFAFLSTFVGALGRVFVPMLRGELLDTWLHVSMGFWTLGFILLFFKFCPLYFRPSAQS